MAFISVTYTFVNGTPADGGEVNTNFQDIIDGLSNGVKDLTVNDITCDTLTCSSFVGPPGGSGIGGLGTIGNIPKFTAARVLGDANITDDGSVITMGLNTALGSNWLGFDGQDDEGITIDTDGWVGINTTPTNAVLEIKDAGSAQLALVYDASNYGIFYGQSDGSLRIDTVGGGQVILEGTGNVLASNGLTIGTGAIGVDYTIKANGETNDLVITAMEDEDYWRFEDDIFLNSTERLYFGDTSSYIYDTGSRLEIADDTSLYIAANATFAADITYEGSIDIHSDTSDGSDNAVINISGGGDVSASRGATIQLFGNEYVAQTGTAKLSAGLGGDIVFAFGDDAGSNKASFVDSGAAEVGYIDSDGNQKIEGNFEFGAATAQLDYNTTLSILAGTSAGSDDGTLILGAASAATSTRGAYLKLYGEETPFNGAAILGTAGPSSGITLEVNGSSKVVVGTSAIDMSDDTKFSYNAYFSAEVDNGNTGAADTLDFSGRNKQKSTWTANTTITIGTNPSGPCNIVYRLINDATGGYTVTWAVTTGSLTWMGGEPTWDTGANKVNLITFYFDGTNYWGSGKGET